jgi:hypothetical protein
VGGIPRRDDHWLQVFLGLPPLELFQRHLTAHAFLNDKGLTATGFAPGSPRDNFIKDVDDQNKHLRSFAFWPVRVIWWTISKRGRIHHRSIEQQYQAGMIRF